MTARTVAVALLLVFAGCSAAVPEVPDEATPAPEWTGDPDNPWRQAELVVAVENNRSRDMRPLVREALDYWEANSERYAGYPLEYELDPDAEDPDLVIAFLDRVRECGPEDHTAGCAPVLTQPGQIRRPVRVTVRHGLSDESTVQVLEHELGHTLGLTHDDEPREIMQATSDITTLPQPDATERALPWDSPDLSVYVDLSNVDPSEREATRAQIDHALDYFDRGAGGTVPENVTFTITDDRAAADVVIAFDGATCETDRGSCGSLKGRDPDGDGALETYTRLDVRLVNLDTEAVAWHVGRWLGRGFGFDEESDFPEPLRSDASFEERRSDWWTG